ncbi:helix-turn-helix transcriptional regulator [Bacillus sp. DTU_2020_1000418_1_SI_GHA_SEK_038]|uniref:helix-turn-helix transcriptional regulator n=1 Tax=Bacillus sp. DTU_2020_1000418_1_SI_GHA_SEK_038 TaxID=3077585 RepID=UPI0028E54F0B|nr:helix-turn-helix transcriptional regulator [Bacillus sp. DTU_2020_1000418_1_SI_GHA_SEK_038]WNS74280.1 helix-turn-helix transcriptional regulator [Bacillus sp. DTU_2020_1000418_1_SI_GHA_SEK_038]
MTTNIRQLREAKGLQQQEMAKMLGYKSLSKYNEIEQGKRGLPASKAILAAKILDCSLDDIFLLSDFPKWTKRKGDN